MVEDEEPVAEHPAESQPVQAQRQPEQHPS
jgi:hypothetical protein